MRPVRTARSNFVWTGPSPEIGDLHAELDREAETTTSVWEPTANERKRIGDGANVAMRVVGMHPPVLLFVTDDQGIGEDAPEVRARLDELIGHRA